MKRPLLNLDQRWEIKMDTYSGALLKLRLAGLRFKRDVGCVRWYLFWRWVKIWEVRLKTSEDYNSK
ncbi:MAG: hypothetical protein ACUZ8H_01530 [Candidatus Anammoxibacter sp.]